MCQTENFVIYDVLLNISKFQFVQRVKQSNLGDKLRLIIVLYEYAK